MKKDSTFFWKALTPFDTVAGGSLMKKKMNRESYELSFQIARIGSRAIRKAHEENHRHNLPNILSRNKRLYFELPDGTITEDNPLE